jgi:SpoVK/Ycf46/Vps4 family AAA+-type ATPase
MVHAIAKERGWDLVIITPADVAQDGPDKIIGRARELLERLSYVERVVVFLDEFELFVRLRGGAAEEQMWMNMITNSMLPLLQELRDRSSIYCFLATNYVSKVDDAAKREGRFDAILPIWPPNRLSRRALIAAALPGGTISDYELEQAAAETKGCTPKELEVMCKRSDHRWGAGSCASDLPKFDDELKNARPPVVAKFD